MTLLEIVNQAQRRLKEEISGSAVSSIDGTVNELRELINEGAQSLALVYGWQSLQREHTWTATATEEQAAGIPSDFSRFINGTFFNRSRNRRVKGPITVEAWQQQKSTVSQVVYDQFRLRGNSMIMMPVPTAGDIYAFEYITTQWCEDSGGFGKTSFTADDDVSRLDDELHVLDAVWRFLVNQGNDATAAFGKFETRRLELFGSDGGSPVLDASGRNHGYYPRIGAAEGGWSIN